MHADQLRVDDTVVRSLLAEQQPAWSSLPLHRVASTGTANALYRVGDGVVLRLPLRPGVTTADLQAEADACAGFAPLLEVDVPEPLHLGSPTEHYPSPWAAYRWIDGEPARLDRIDDLDRFAVELATALQTIRTVPTQGRTWPGHGRGGPIASTDEWVRQQLRASRGLVDVDTLQREWDEALTLPPAPEHSWQHGDAMPGNLLLRDGRLAALIDWELARVSDPALDLQPAWNLLPTRQRRTFRVAMDLDEPAWRRGRAWALEQAIGGLPSYLTSNPAFSRSCLSTLNALLADFT